MFAPSPPPPHTHRSTPTIWCQWPGYYFLCSGGEPTKVVVVDLKVKNRSQKMSQEQSEEVYGVVETEIGPLMTKPRKLRWIFVRFDLQLLSHLEGDELNVALLVPEVKRATQAGLVGALTENYGSPGRLADYQRQFERMTCQEGELCTALTSWQCSPGDSHSGNYGSM